ncbi:DUF1846 domain-containing protein [Criibacterium bergeronii]|uniref:DUF1846 domain-containing protein n=1 Tax=Criibacterium bergeronii TaxID=1871336 RepID=A0A371IN60_9FIRM|nr:DUF1846 domain-containing protein [Criibacterium bergeronii]RDY21928.1 DUF1846 domain-containing protein [Criibacterium bergeronii]
MKKGFDEKKYLELQSKHILERVNQFDKLYLEFGGKLLHDTHAMRVLPGYSENTKIKLLQGLKDKLEVIICVYSGHIENSKVIGDSGISYELGVFRLIDDLRAFHLQVNSVVITRYEERPTTDTFIKKLERRNIKTYKHKSTAGYPTDVETVVSEQGYGKNEYIKTEKPIVVVTAPGPGSGKLGTCLSQVYHEFAMGNSAGYAKFETFPVWNLPLKHPINVAYEAATSDLKDVNVIDSFHMDAYNIVSVNYNRDMESFPLLRTMLNKITGEDKAYKSPTDMGVNRIKDGIVDDEVVREASKQEVIRRYLLAKVDYVKGSCDSDMVDRLKILMQSLDINEEYRKSLVAARKKAELINAGTDDNSKHAMAIELTDGTILTGKSSNIMEASAALILNALKYFANIDDDMLLLAPLVLTPITELKKVTDLMGNKTLNMEEVLIALSICAATNTMAEKALSKIKNLRFCKAHSTCIISSSDEQMFSKLGVDVTCDPVFADNNLFYNL